MSVVTVLFAVIFWGVLHFTKVNIERESIQMMRAMAFQPMNSAPVALPQDNDKKIRLPFFTLNPLNAAVGCNPTNQVKRVYY